VGLSTNIASGDREATDPDLETFNPLFPRGSYFSETALLGPRNFFNVQPSLTLTPLESVSVTVDMNWFWRLQTKDGLYSPSGQLLRGANGSTARFVGSNLAVKTAWQLQRHVTISANYEHFFPGAFLRETGSHAAIDFVELTLQCRF
jgi:Alginate export